jgi:collagenase-like PrtC family protease
MKISLGSIQNYWPADKIKRFYHQVKDWPLDIVYIGEVICSKRQELSLLDWLYIADMLTEAGKEVVLSTLVQIESAPDLRSLMKICENGDYKVEANSEAAIRKAFGRPFVAGASLNTNSKDVLKELEYYGAVRWVMPVGYSLERLRNISDTRPDGMQIEVFVYGGLPMSYSSNCITALAHHLTKDTCDAICKKYNEGMELSNKEVSDTLIVNGFQIQTGRPCNLIGEISNLKSAGVDVIRISPQLNQTEEIVENFAQVLSGTKANKNFIESNKWCNEYWYGDEKVEQHNMV